jgi:hypothetical protein
MDFGEALHALKAGKKAARSGWNGKEMWLALQRPAADDPMTLPYVYMEYPKGHKAHPNGCRVPWLASQHDILAEDWSVIGG